MPPPTDPRSMLPPGDPRRRGPPPRPPSEIPYTPPPPPPPPPPAPLGISQMIDAASVFSQKMFFLSSNAQFAAGIMMRFAEKASPSHVLTFMNSIDLVTARLGAAFLPAIEVASREVQRFSEYLASREGRQAITTASIYGAGVMGNIIGSLGGAAKMMTFMPRLVSGRVGGKGDSLLEYHPATAGLLAAARAVGPMRLPEDKKTIAERTAEFNQSGVGQAVRWVTMAAPAGLLYRQGVAALAEKPGRLDTSLAGMPKPQAVTAEEYLDKLVTASLDLDQQTLKIMQEQLTNMQTLPGKLDKIDASVNNIKGFR